MRQSSINSSTRPFFNLLQYSAAVYITLVKDQVKTKRQQLKNCNDSSKQLINNTKWCKHQVRPQDLQHTVQLIDNIYINVMYIYFCSTCSKYTVKMSIINHKILWLTTTMFSTASYWLIGMGQKVHFLQTKLASFWRFCLLEQVLEVAIKSNKYVNGKWMTAFSL